MGLVHTILSEGECRDVAGGVRPDSRTGVLLSDKETREVLGRLRGGGSLAEEKRQGGQTNGDGEDGPPTQLGRQRQGPQGGPNGPG